MDQNRLKEHPFLKMNALYELNWNDSSKSILFILSFESENNDEFYQLKFLDDEGIQTITYHIGDFTQQGRHLLSIVNPKAWREIT
jgi:hypothetical protein